MSLNDLSGGSAFGGTRPAHDVLVPASVANLGAGFDALAVAVQLYLRVRIVDVRQDGQARLTVVRSTPPVRGRNAVERAYEAIARRTGLRAPSVSVEVESDIPMASGLGSSAAAVVAGLRVFEHLAADAPGPQGSGLRDEVLLGVAASLEGHADNAAAGSVCAQRPARVFVSNFCGCRLSQAGRGTDDVALQLRDKLLGKNGLKYRQRHFAGNGHPVAIGFDLPPLQGRLAGNVGAQLVEFLEAGGGQDRGDVVPGGEDVLDHRIGMPVASFAHDGRQRKDLAEHVVGKGERIHAAGEDDAAWGRRAFTTGIMVWAMAEGAAVMAGVVWFLTGKAWVLAVAADTESGDLTVCGDLTVIGLSGELAVSSSADPGPELDAKKTVLLGTAKATADKMEQEARAEKFTLAVKAFGSGSAYTKWQFAEALPLDIALFHVAAPYPGTPFFFEVVENNWFRAGTNWEEVDMDQATVLDYENLSAEDLLKWQKRAFREWAFRPGPIFTMLKSMNTWAGFKSAVDIGLQTVGWVRD